jgi:hypothetical protein
VTWVRDPGEAARQVRVRLERARAALPRSLAFSSQQTQFSIFFSVL